MGVGGWGRVSGQRQASCSNSHEEQRRGVTAIVFHRRNRPKPASSTAKQAICKQQQPHNYCNL